MDVKDGEAFWNELGAEGPSFDRSSFIAVLAETWDMPDTLSESITRDIIRLDTDGEKVAKTNFLNFVRTFGPWPHLKPGGPNPMLGLLLRDFFDPSTKRFRGNFHGYLDERSAYRLLKNPGEFLYRYSAGSPGAIAISRTSTTLKAGKLQYATDLLLNTGAGTWQHSVTKANFASLAEFEHKHKEKLLRLICSFHEASTGNYGAFLMGDDDSTTAGYA